ncbi:MAG: glutamine-hydrolyzing carbamoyl-phosphate synthase small subunit [Phycisphaerales bacterium]
MSDTSPRSKSPAPARIALEDGSVWHGRALGATGRGAVVTAEAVFNTAMAGYQEALTDPSYAGQALIMTAPIVGIYGVNDEDVESKRVQVAAFIVHELARRTSNWRASTDLSTYLEREGVLGVAGVDTRALTRRLRTGGAMRCALTDDASISDADLVERARSAPSMAGQNLVTGVGASERRTTAPSGARRRRVLALDCGAKENIVRCLADLGCEVVSVPHDTTAAAIREAYERGEVDGVLVSNGPGDPASVTGTIATLRDLVGPHAEPAIPTFGICLGHQLLALALGAETFKLKFGHRGVNQPVRDEESGRVEITSQNHGFAVDPVSLREAGGEPTHVNLNDGTLAGFRVPGRPVFAVQHHPEASPGPHDAAHLFGRFVEMMDAARHAPTNAEHR